MSRFVLLAVAAVVVSTRLAAAPVPTDVKSLVAGLGDPSAKVRDEAAAALRGRADALPWLRRAARSTDRDTAQRASALLAPHETRRQAEVAQAIDACIKSGQVDLFMEWHHYWQPENKDDLWPVGPRMARAGEDEYAKWGPPDVAKRFEGVLNCDKDKQSGLKPLSHDGPEAQLPQKVPASTTLSIRTDQWWNRHPGVKHVAFASVAGPTLLEVVGGQGRFFVLGPVSRPPDPTGRIALVVCDGDFSNGSSYRESRQHWGSLNTSFVVCRGTYRGGSVGASVLLVDGDVELLEDERGRVVDSLIRATGEIRIPKTVKVADSTIQEHARNATAPYRFFDLEDVGLSVVDDEEGLVVAGVTPGTPFGNCGLVKGDIIQAIDDAGPGGHSSAFTRKVRRAVVRQGDCLLTVARGDKAIDLAVYFPVPK